MGTASFGGYSAGGKMGGMSATGKVSNLSAGGKIGNMTASSKLGCLNAVGTMGGNAQTSNSIKRSFSFKAGQLIFPTTPQLYGMEYEDVNGVFWQCFAGETLWEKVNHMAPGV